MYTLFTCVQISSNRATCGSDEQPLLGPNGRALSQSMPHPSDRIVWRCCETSSGRLIVFAPRRALSHSHHGSWPDVMWGTLDQRAHNIVSQFVWSKSSLIGVSCSFAKHGSHSCVYPKPGPREREVLKVRCFNEVSFMGSKEVFVKRCNKPGRGSGGDAPPPFGSVSVEAIQETRFMGEFPNLSVVADLSPWMVLSLTSCPKTGTVGSRLLTLQWGSEVHWLLRHQYGKMVHFVIDCSGWSSLRSLNSCSHCLREALFLDSRSSRSQTCRFRLDRFMWGVWLKG